MKTKSLCLVALFAATGACTKTGGSGGADGDKLKELTERIEKLEAAQKSFSEVDKFVRPIMQQQAAQAKQKAASEPDPNVRFAVSVDGNDVEGPATAAVTIIEAWDFA